MARDNRTITRAVRTPGEWDENGRQTKAPRRFLPGQEDELQAALSKSQIEHYTERGTLAGNWGTSSDANTSDAKTLTDSVVAKLAAANIATDESLQSVSDDDLKAAELTAAQIKNVRSVYGEYSEPVA